MGSLRFISQVITELKAALEADVPAAVAAANAAYADDVVLAVPRTYERGDRVNLLPNQLPAVLIIGDQSSVLQDNYKHLDMRHLVVVGVYFTEGTEEVLQEKAYRYAEVIMNALADHRVSPGFAFRLHFAGTGQAIDYSPRKSPEGNLFEADVFVPMFCDKEAVR